jgi:mutator family transposase
MALDKSALSELLDALRAGGDLDVVREGMQLVLQALIELEATEVIGAGRYERSPERVTQRNGARARLLSTKAGDLELRILKAAPGRLLPGPPGAAPAHRPRALGGGHGGLRARGLHPQGGRPGARARNRRRHQ